MDDNYIAIDYAAVLEHVGVGHENGGHSGRYPWGSGENPHQHSGEFMFSTSEDFYNKVQELTKKYGEKKAAEMFDMSTNQLRDQKAIARADFESAQYRKIRKLIDEEGYSRNAAAKELGWSEATVRAWESRDSNSRAKRISNTADKLADAVAKKGYIDVGDGVDSELGISKKDLSTAVELLKNRGYETATVNVPQVGQSHQYTNVKVLAAPGTTRSDFYENRLDVQSVNVYSKDNGKTWFGIETPKGIDRSRVAIRYADEGGVEKDGVIEIRRGVKDVSLGDSQYAQVRIQVGDNYYLKGMAIYSDDKNFPAGCDILVNSNKASGTADEDVFKSLKKDKLTGKVDKNNPFGAMIHHQVFYEDPDGEYALQGDEYVKTKKKSSSDETRYSLGVVNKVKEEGEWEKYTKSVASQMLSKQPQELVEKQLNISYADKQAEYEEICGISNPTVRKAQLLDFAANCDKAAVTLKAAAFPGQTSKVILPVSSLKDDEIYAPTYEDGTKLALIRYPHAGTFEIPVLKVNNKQAEAKAVLGNAGDAVGINSKVAEQLSGADFDGDSVVCIPTDGRNGVKITHTRQLEGLKGFSTNQYAFTKEQLEASPKDKDGNPKCVMTEITKQRQMGEVSNLITDMTLVGAPPEDMERAVKHSMVVIDGVKHKLDVAASAKENDIQGLKKIYQYDPITGKSGGASTIISKAKSEYRVDERDDKREKIDSETGEKIFSYTGNSYKKLIVRNPDTGRKETVYDNKANREKYDGNIIEEVEVKRQQKSTKMYEANDAMELVSAARNPKEILYANYANHLKALANDARKEAVNTSRQERDPSAAKTYATEVSELQAAINTAIKNQPKERQAQMLANKRIEQYKERFPMLRLKENREELSKVERQALAGARMEVGASGKKSRIHITDKQWEAIQAGAISETMLEKVLRYADSDEVTNLARPKSDGTLSTAQINRIYAMRHGNWTIKQIADAVGCSPSTVSSYLQKEGA